MKIGQRMVEAMAAGCAVEIELRTAAREPFSDGEHAVGVVLFHGDADGWLVLRLWHGVEIADDKIRLDPELLAEQEAGVRRDLVIAGLRPFAQTVERPGGIDETTLHGEYLFVTWFVLLYEIWWINARKQPRKEPLKMEQRTKSSVVEAGDFAGCNGEGCLHS